MSVIDLSRLCSCCSSGASSGSGGSCCSSPPSTVYVTITGGPGGWASSYTLTPTTPDSNGAVWQGTGSNPCGGAPLILTLYCNRTDPYSLTISDIGTVSGTIPLTVISCNPFHLQSVTPGFVYGCYGMNYYGVLHATITE